MNAPSSSKWTLRPLLVGVVGFVLLSLTGCVMVPAIHGDGNIVSEKRNVGGFDRVAVAGTGRVHITQGSTESLEIKADQNLLPYIESVVEGGQLKIRHKRSNLRFSESPVYTLQLKELRSLSLSGSLQAEMEELSTEDIETSISGSGGIRFGHVVADAVEWDVSGSGEVHFGHLSADSLEAHVSGSGKVQVNGGEAERLEVLVSGSGECRAVDFEVNTVKIHISGSGSAEVWAKEQLSASVSGSGRVDYYGSPQTATSISGSGKINGRGAKP